MRQFAIAAALIAVISGFLLEGTFLHIMLPIIAALYLGPPVVLLMTLWFFIGWRRTRGIPRGWESAFCALLILGGSLLLSLATGIAVHQWQIREARNYVAKLVPQLDAYRRAHGHYPPTLAAVNAPSPPKLLQHENCYATESDSYWFEYPDHSGMADAYYFDGTTLKWTHFDSLDGH